MGTVVTIEVVGHSATSAERAVRGAALDRAVDWFRETEACCSRFDPSSEVSRLASRPGEPVVASPMLMGAVRFALALANETAGAFDPAIGHALESRGDNVEYRTGAVVRTAPAATGDDPPPSWRDIEVDAERGTITLLRPLMLDLGAVAKGLAIDLAVRELRELENFAIDAGGDLYLAGRNAQRDPWSVGIRHPREEGTIQTLHVSNMSVCTSGDYARRFPSASGAMEHHILDPRTGETAAASISATVVASSAMVADALATAAFVLGANEGVALLEQHGVDGFIISSSLERYETQAMHAYA